MSNMNFLEKLLDGVAVEWKSLKDLTTSTKNIKWREVDRSYRYIDLTSVSIETKTITETTEITSADAPSRAQKIVEENDVVFATTRPTQKRYCLISAEYAGQVASTGYCVLRAKTKEILPKWIWHWIASSDFNNYVEENQSGSAYPAISDAKVKDFKIPIPCPENPEKSLEIQAEIVRILDAMTAHTAELTAELTARKKQYNYYRDKLLSFEDEEVEWLSMGDVATVTKLAGFEFTNHIRYSDTGNIIALRGLNVKGNLDLSDVKYIDESNLSKLTRSKLYIDDMLFTYVGTVGSVALINKNDKYYLAPNVALVRLETKKIIPRFMFYYFQTSDFRKTQIDRYSGNSSMQNLTMENIRKFKIAIPSVSEQARIVAFLDKFDALTSSLTEGLPREIELRQKQYAYYRDLLLSFPKPEMV